MRFARARSRGISLIEAMVALAVMAFGTLGVLGVQTTLRLNADIAKQRNEAVRIGQETIEAARSFELVRSDDANIDTWAGIVDAVVDPVLGYTVANTSYRVETRIEEATGLHDPRVKTMVVDVSWKDRSDQDQSIRLNSSVHGVPPALAGSLALPTDSGPVRNPGGRHPSIPREAVPSLQDAGKSIFTPPGADEVRWVFDNSTGMITSICMPADSCTAASAFLLAGYVRFATDALGQPLPSQAENPTGPALPINVQMAQTAPVAATVECFEQTVAGALRYFCAVPAGTVTPLRWSGRSTLTDLTLAASAADNDSAAYRVCRYTPVRGCHEVVGPLPPRVPPDPPYPPEADSLIWGMPDATASCTEPAPQTVPPTPSRILRNVDHPLDYDKVTGALTNQNFLVIRAGDGTDDAFECPGDDAGTPYVNGNTWHHQPAN